MKDILDPRTVACGRAVNGELCKWHGNVRDVNHLDFIETSDWECPRCRQWSITTSRKDI
jgi:hypothetical protein